VLWLRRALFYVVLWGLMGVASILALEVGIRVWIPALNPSTQLVFYSDNAFQVPLGRAGEVYRHRHNPGDFDVTVQFNRHGLRDTADVALATSADWLYVGDSFGFGFGVEESERVSSRLQERWRESGVRVYNVSAPTHIAGYGRLLQYAGALGSGAGNVVIQVFTGNDLLDYDATAVTHTPFVSRGQQLRFYVSVYSATYQAVRYLAWNAPGVRDVLGRASADRAEEGFVATMNPQLVAVSARVTGEVLRDWGVDVGAPAGESLRDEAVSLGAPAGESLRDVAVSLGAPAGDSLAGKQYLVVVAPPKSLWVGPAEQRQIWRALHGGYVDALREKGIRVLDLAGAFDQTADPLAYYFETDGHWNARGHAFVADTLAAYLGKNP
jgi:lysophospholipase L1-like esterase